MIDAAASNVSVEVLLGQVADEFTERLKRGEQPDIDDYARRHPEIAELLRQVLPALQVLGSSGSANLGADGRSEGLEAGPAGGGVLGDFRIIREVGRGGMGIVYEAEQMSLGRRVALKVLPFAAALHDKGLQRFKNEALAAAQLDHPHIVDVLGVGSERGVHYYAMRLIEGHTLAEVIEDLRQATKGRQPGGLKSSEDRDAASGGLQPQLAEQDVGHVCKRVPTAEQTLDYAPAAAERPVASAAPTVAIAGLSTERSSKSREFFQSVARLGSNVAEALEQAHEQGIIHRDIKPSNLMLDSRGKVWVTDFGLAHVQGDKCLTMSGDLLGTLRYMSPEQALAQRVLIDHRTDIYSLGVTLYELLTLEPAFAGEDRQEVLRRIAFEEPRPIRRLAPTVPVELETIVHKALEKNPADRYGTAQELADDLRRFLEDRPIQARPPSWWQRGSKWVRRHQAAVRAAAAALLVVVAVLAATAGWWLRDRAVREAATDQAVSAALDEAQRLQDDRKVPEALGMVQRAEAILAGGAGTPVLEHRVQERLADLKVVMDLEEIRAEQTISNKGPFIDYASADRNYAEAFQAFGIDVDAMPAEEAARRMRQRTVAVELAAALDDWSYMAKEARPTDAARWQRLLAVARVADPDPLRSQLRQAVAKGDPQLLKTMVASVRVEELPPGTLVAISLALGSSGAHDREVLLRQAQRHYPADFRINIELARIIQQRQPPQHEEAIRFYTAALAIRPKSAVAHNNLGNALTAKGRLDEAIAVYRQGIKFHPDHAMAHNGLGNALQKKGQLDEAIAAYREAIKLKPDYANAHYNLGNTLWKKGRIDDGIAAYREAIKHNPDFAEAHFNLAVELHVKGRLDEAIAANREAIKLRPDFAMAHFNLAGTLHVKGRLDEAIAAYREAIKLQPDYVLAHNYLGNVLRNKGQVDEAIAAYREAIKLQPNYSGTHNDLGKALTVKGRLDEAIAAYREAIKLQPDYAEPYSNLALVYATAADPRFRDPNKAVLSAKKAVDIYPKDCASWNTLGAVYYRNGNYNAAVEALSQSMKLQHGENGFNFFFLAMAHWQGGDKDQARTWYAKAVQWMEKYQPPQAELRRYRKEAEELLGIAQPKPSGTQPTGGPKPK